MKEDKLDYADYLQKCKQEPDPQRGSVIWRDDPAARGENFKRVQPLKDRKKALRKRKRK